MVDVEEVVRKLDSLGYIRSAKVTGNWYQIYCPFHGNGQERKPSCGVLLRDEYKNGHLYSSGMFHCFACGWNKSLNKSVTEILKLRGSKQAGSEWLQENIPGFHLDNSEIQSLVPEDIMSTVMQTYASESLRMRFVSKAAYVSEEELASYRYTVPYMYERKLNDYVIDKYDVGYDANFIPPGRSKPLPCITFPVRDMSGNTLFFCRRSIQGKFFHYPEGVSKPVYGLYELPTDCKSVIICESVFNALTAVVYGYNAVALLGTGNAYQITQLQRLGVREYILCLDNDEAGSRGAKKLKSALKNCAFVWTMHVPEGKDANDLSKEEFDACYAEKD